MPCQVLLGDVIWLGVYLEVLYLSYQQPLNNVFTTYSLIVVNTLSSSFGDSCSNRSAVSTIFQKVNQSLTFVKCCFQSKNMIHVFFVQNIFFLFGFCLVRGTLYSINFTDVCFPLISQKETLTLRAALFFLNMTQATTDRNKQTRHK